MKKIFSILLMFVLGIALVACSPKEKKEVQLDENFPVLEDTRSIEYKENTITTLNGNDVTYNMNTRKIVCIFGSQDVVAFGIKLLAYENSTSTSGYEKYYEGAKKLENSSPFSYEEIYSYNPELILVNERMSSDNIKTLSKICPTIPLFTDSTDFSVRLKFIGKMFGLEESANKLIEYEQKLKTDMLENLKTLNIGDKTLTIYTYMGGVSLVPERGFFMNTIIFEYLGVNRLDIVKEFMQDESQLAYEPIADSNIKDYEGDLVFFAATGTKTISTYVSEKPGWKMLKAVKENRVGIIDMDVFAQKGAILLYDQYSQILDAFKVALKA